MQHKQGNYDEYMRSHCTVSQLFVCSSLIFLFFFFFFGLVAYGIPVPQTVIQPLPLAAEAQTLNHWTTREVPCSNFL